MPKGFYSQCFCILTDGSTTIADIKSAIEAAKYEIANEVEASPNWEMSGPSVVIPYLPEKNGYLAVDVVERPWPDSMGDPKSEPLLFGAWSMSQFGPGTFPGGLARARQHAWTCREADPLAASHRGFIRMRLSYVFGASDDAPILPQEYDPVGEMIFLTRVTTALLSVRGVLCCFNPSGEVLCDPTLFTQTWSACQQQQKLPLLLWSNVRLFNLSKELGFMDTVGNMQIDIRDVEAIFPSAQYEPNDIAYYLRNVSHYLMHVGRDIRTGEAFDGPDEQNLSWMAESSEKGLVTPSRRILRLFPKSIHEQVERAKKSLNQA